MISTRLRPFIGTNWADRLVRGTARFTFATTELIFVSAVMQMELALPMAYYFHRATTLGLPANLVVVPVIQLMIPAAVTALVLGSVALWAAKIPAMLTTAALAVINGTVHGLGGLRLADLRVAMPSTLLIVLAIASLIFVIWTSRKRALLAVIGLTVLLLTSLALALLHSKIRMRPGSLEVTSIDVGEGDSSLLVTPEGRTLLIDAGGPIGPGGSQLDFGEDVVSPYLWTRDISQLDAVAITHGHSDPSAE